MTPVVVAAQGNDVVTGVEDQDVEYAELIRLDARTGAVETTTAVSHGMAGAIYWRGWLWTLRRRSPGSWPASRSDRRGTGGRGRRARAAGRG
jgi:hypothetical protein